MKASHHSPHGVWCPLSTLVALLWLQRCSVRASAPSPCAVKENLTPNTETDVKTLAGDSITCYTFYMPDRATDAVIVLSTTSGEVGLYGLSPSKAGMAAFPTPSINSFSATQRPLRHVIYRNTPQSEKGIYSLTVYNHEPNLVAYKIAFYLSTPATSVPTPDATEMAALADLDFLCCKMAGSCATWTKLGGLAANHCGIPGSLCNAQGKLTHFTMVGDEAEDTMLCQFPNNVFGNFSALQHLNLRSNKFSGDVNWALLAKGLPQLEYLDLAFNELLSGPIGCDFASGSLLHLDLTTNSFSGALPTCYMQKEDMQVLRLSDNALTGPLPATLPPLSKLQWLAIDRNEDISGSITPLSTLMHARIIDLSGNSVDGYIPNDLGVNQPYLLQVSLNDNLLSGTIPDAIPQSSRLQSLLLRTNELTGGLPSRLATIHSLRELWLGENELSGEMPLDWSAMANLQDLDLSSNSFTGNIPQSILNLPSLKSFNISANYFSGLLPPRDNSTQSVLAQFDASKNMLTGHIPVNYSSLPAFSPEGAKNFAGQQISTVFLLAYNQLSGDLPSFMLPDALPSWSTIDFTGNDNMRCPEHLIQYVGIYCNGNKPSQGQHSASAKGPVLFALLVVALVLLMVGLCAGAAFVHLRWRNTYRFVRIEGDGEARALTSRSRIPSTTSRASVSSATSVGEDVRPS